MKARNAYDESRFDRIRERSVCEFVRSVPWCDGRKIEKLLGGGDRRAQHHCHKIPDANFLQMYERGN